MTISVGARIPEAELLMPGADGPHTVRLGDRLRGRKVVVIGMPGAFTRVCGAQHLPSFVRTAEAFRARGIDEIICVTVNDPFVLKAWGDSTGATAAGITLMGDADGALTRALGMAFDAPKIGLYGRSNRFAVVVEDGVVTRANIDRPGECSLSTGEKLLAAL